MPLRLRGAGPPPRHVPRAPTGGVDDPQAEREGGPACPAHGHHRPRRPVGRPEADPPRAVGAGQALDPPQRPRGAPLAPEPAQRRGCVGALAQHLPRHRDELVQVERHRLGAADPGARFLVLVPEGLFRLPRHDLRALETDGAARLRHHQRQPVLLQGVVVVSPGHVAGAGRGLAEGPQRVAVAGDGQLLVQPVGVRQRQHVRRCVRRELRLRNVCGGRGEGTGAAAHPLEDRAAVHVRGRATWPGCRRAAWSGARSRAWPSGPCGACAP